ncbi:hypothetical protein PAI11_34910 [Patulibacter medicamentivorans]|uniref:Uncharacterized protein n=1 Tax=Patulibacter medicamentivorans TaxID=1097667 RepID=H0E9H2_9ACTN|nr:hypothetical protein PAI11_34910 [Patulibacter medicamentivorans]
MARRTAPARCGGTRAERDPVKSSSRCPRPRDDEPAGQSRPIVISPRVRAEMTIRRPAPPAR